jgi:hypothetical protein
MEFYPSQTDEAVEQRFRIARRFEAQVCFWVQDHRFRAVLGEGKIRARGAETEASKRGERPDHPDLWLPDLRLAIEVKGRNLWFKYYRDFPKDPVYICSENSFEKMQASGIPRAALVIVSMPTKHMLAIPWRPKLWWPEPTTQRDGYTYNVMVANLDQLRPMSRLLEFLRKKEAYLTRKESI